MDILVIRLVIAMVQAKRCHMNNIRQPICKVTAAENLIGQI